MNTKACVPSGPDHINYYKGGWNIGQKARVGPHKKEVISMARIYNQRPGRLRMHVYGGPTKKDTKLATVETIPFKKQGWTKWLRFFPGVRSGVPSDVDIILFPDESKGKGKNHEGAERIEIRGRQFRFTAAVGHGQQHRLETFEWRWSDGGEVGHYTKRIPETNGRGWKLLRLDTEGQDGSRDQKECVAAFSQTGKFGSKSHRYQLFNSGASGLLGERFELYAYLTFQAILDQEAREAAKAAAERQARMNQQMNRNRY
ncbi:hypothetical protein J7T55_009919 [Diaporthe amygdali]|uniref:uncharacterized protein n=1 Tax=Phomopsis amygdali TaxID=1214568 RepID=UPI0022FDF274|nr:uncharacterized protein J7T55_009919 [Diaporthe amygdali]KAJ0116768.1 hypothetical protein J7T55_009919 [Diaporthe amygdali]